MKNTIIVLAGALFCGALTSTLWAREWLTRPQIQAQIRRDATDILRVEKNIGKCRTEITKTRKKLENEMLTQQERFSMQGLIGRDKGTIADFHDEAMDEIGFMRSHWADLTQSQKDLVSEAMIDLG